MTSSNTEFDLTEKSDILIKTAFGFPSTNENTPWYSEVFIPFDNYVFGDEILVEQVPSSPEFNTVKTASDVSLNTDDFINYSADSNNISQCSIVDDSTGTIRRYQGLILDPISNGLNANADGSQSWRKLDSNGNNILKNGLQFNYKQQGATQPFLYLLSKKNGGSIPFGSSGGNWYIDLKSGVLLFNDYSTSICSISNPPVLTYYTYVGKKGLSNLTVNTSSNSGGGSSSGSGSGSSSTLNNKNQTFFDLLTQQPHQFTFDSSSNTTGNITLSWNFDDLIPNITNHTERALLNLYSSGTNRYLPSITEIKFDLSHSTLTSGWNNYSSFTKSVGSNDYNSGTTYKTLNITKQTNPGGSGISGLLSSTNKFDIRIYGVNNSINYPDEDTRALIVEQISFKEASPPNTPNFSSTSLSGNNQINLNYSVNQIEAGETSTSAVLDHTQTKYHLNTTLSHYNFDTTMKDDGTETESGTGNFTTQLTGLYYGSNYNFLTRISNNLTTLYNITDTNWNSITINTAPNEYFNTNKLGPSVYTNLPGTTGTNTSATSLPSAAELSYNRNNGPSKSYGGFCLNDTTTTFNSDQHIYMNQNFSSTTASGESSNPETFEVSDTTKTGNNLGGVSSGIGKYLNGVTDMVTITASVNSSVLQTIKYHGFNSSADTGMPSPTQSGNTNFFDSISQYDPHTAATTKGFRVNGRFHVKDIHYSTVNSVIGSPSSTPYNLTLSFSRDATKTNSGSRSYTTYIYVDSLNDQPTITNETNTSEVKSVKYCMGIPSVDKFNIDLTRTYGNINSTYGYIRGDKILAYFGGISNVAGDSNGYQYISSVNSNGIYSIAPTYYSNGSGSGKLYHTTARTGTSNFNVAFNEQVYSLYGTNNRGNINVSLNHYYDRNSFANDTATTGELSISSGDIMEVGSVSNFGNDLTALTQTSYTNHTTLVQNHTLLYLNGQFRSPSSYTYPNTNNFTWDSVSHNTYTAGSTGLNTSGSSTTSSPYKWITFRIERVTYNSSTSVLTMSCNGTNYTVSVGSGTSDNVFDLGSLLSNNGFDSTTINNIFNAGNSNAIAILRLTTNDGKERVGHTKQAYQGNTFDWLSSSSGLTEGTSYDPKISLSTLISTFSSNTSFNGRYSTENKIVLYASLMNNGGYFYVYVGLK